MHTPKAPKVTTVGSSTSTGATFHATCKPKAVGGMKAPEGSCLVSKGKGPKEGVNYTQEASALVNVKPTIKHGKIGS